MKVLTPKVFSVNFMPPFSSSKKPLSHPRDCYRLKHLALLHAARSLPLRILALLIAVCTTLAAAHGADSPLYHNPDSTDSLLQDSAVARALAVTQPDQMALEAGSQLRGRDIGTNSLGVVTLSGSTDGTLQLSSAPSFSTKLGNRYASITPRNNVVFYTIDPELQEFVSRTIVGAKANHVAVVAMNPRTGAILAIAGRSPTIPGIEFHAGFPAASLFKVVTAAAAIEKAGIAPDSLVAFRGGNYTLNQWNYLPNPGKDRRVMSVGEAMGRSCNPVFGQLGIKYLDGSILSRYANRFGFNRTLPLEVPLPASSAQIPSSDLFALSRTSAGFGEVRISPVHAAAVVSAIGNGGLLPRPHMIERIANLDGVTLEKTRPETLQSVMQPETAATLLEMMRYTTTVGTSRREFMPGGRPALGSIEVFGKTGTLSGSNPPGRNNWFIGAAPLNNPELAVAVITVDATHSAKASRIARLVMHKIFNVEAGPEPTELNSDISSHRYKRSVKSYHQRSKSPKASNKFNAGKFSAKKKKPSSAKNKTASKSKPQLGH